jgi:hypothetical protein
MRPVVLRMIPTVVAVPIDVGRAGLPRDHDGRSA